MIDEKLKETLRLHARWREDPLTGARANLSGWNLRGACLRGAYFIEANLVSADLLSADLVSADFRGADFRGADLREAKLPHFQICPEEGSFFAWKKAGHYIVKLEIPAEARRTSCLISRKCRAEFVRVLEIEGGRTETRSDRGGVYQVGEITSPDSYCEDIRIDCSNGIHFFMTRKEAEEWV